MLQAMLLAGIVAAPLGSAALFLPVRRHARRAGVWSAIRRFSLAVIGTVGLHVPAHNEPPEMVIETLRSLLRLDYPRYEIILIDDNTDDEELWRPVEAWCARHGVKFAHLDNWPGYKSGALNYALRMLTAPEADVIGVVDSDYQIEPGFLRRCAPAFADPWIGFVQSPQDYRDWTQAATTAGCTTPTSTSSRSRSPLATSTTEPSSPAPWG